MKNIIRTAVVVVFFLITSINSYASNNDIDITIRQIDDSIHSGMSEFAYIVKSFLNDLTDVVITTNCGDIVIEELGTCKANSDVIATLGIEQTEENEACFESITIKKVTAKHEGKRIDLTKNISVERYEYQNIKIVKK